MFCENCGRKISADMAFCEECGSPVPVSTDFKLKKKSKVGFIIALIILVVLLAIGCIFLFADRDKETSYEVYARYADLSDMNVAEYIEGKNFPDVYVSSTLEPMYGYYYDWYNMFDGDTDTAWVENKEDTGIGEYIELTYSDEYEIAAFSIINGYAKSERIFNKNCAVKRFNITVNGLNYGTLILEHNYSRQYFVLPETIEIEKGDVIRFTIEDTYVGINDDESDTAITEFCIYYSVEN